MPRRIQVVKHIRLSLLKEYNSMKEIPWTRDIEQFERGKVDFRLYERKIDRSEIAVGQLNDGRCLLCYRHRPDQIVPFPDFVLVYFRVAQTLTKQLDEKRDDMMKYFKFTEKSQEEDFHIFYEYLGRVSGFCALIVMAMEAFLNKNLPESSISHGKKDENDKITAMNNDQLEKLSIMDKVRVVGGDRKLNVELELSKEYKHLEILVKLRNDTVHLKYDPQYRSYRDVTSKLINLRYRDYTDSVATIMNALVPGTIENCPCTVDEW